MCVRWCTWGATWRTMARPTCMADQRADEANAEASRWFERAARAGDVDAVSGECCRSSPARIQRARDKGLSQEGLVEELGRLIRERRDGSRDRKASEDQKTQTGHGPNDDDDHVQRFEEFCAGITAGGGSVSDETQDEYRERLLCQLHSLRPFTKLELEAVGPQRNARWRGLGTGRACRGSACPTCVQCWASYSGPRGQ
eukprot:jgi/Mesvir1/13871/Mv16011-RA.1